MVFFKVCDARAPWGGEAPLEGEDPLSFLEQGRALLEDLEVMPSWVVAHPKL